ncbi:MAG: Eco57I restriction-modification methylase domain-containing protein [Promethearchaeota archaeon]
MIDFQDDRFSSNMDDRFSSNMDDRFSSNMDDRFSSNMDDRFSRSKLDNCPLLPNLDLNLKVGDSLIREKINDINEVSTQSNLNHLRNHENIKKTPFNWDIDFAEIFKNKGGFDIVIGNPPYINYKKIIPPNLENNKLTERKKKDYKNKLVKSIKTQFNVIKTFSKTSDYYIYFYFIGLSLLNPKGTFCFITSNAWLDTDYGKYLQEFLLKYVPIIAIYDSSQKSFIDADINTVIVLLDAPKIKNNNDVGIIENIKTDNIKQYYIKWPALSHIAKFIMFKKTFEEIAKSGSQYLIDIENINGMNAPNAPNQESHTSISKDGNNSTNNSNCYTIHDNHANGIIDYIKCIVDTNFYRVFPISQESLLEDGWEYPKHYYCQNQNYYYKNKNQFKDKFKEGCYVGNKWGGKFLRAPKIFFIILEKGKEKFVKLGNLANLITGVKEGGYKEYIVNISKLTENIQDFSKYIPILKNVKEHNKIIITQNDSFIVKNIDKFKKIVEQRRSIILWLSGRGTTHKCYKNPKKFTFTGNFIGIESNDIKYVDYLVGYLNSTLCILLSEIEGRNKGIGGAAAVFSKTDLEKLEILFDPENDNLTKKVISAMNILSLREIKPIFEEIGLDPLKNIREQNPRPLPDRKELDDAIFNEIGLTEDEIKEVYWALAELIKLRLDKAKSLRKIKKGLKKLT